MEALFPILHLSLLLSFCSCQTNKKERSVKIEIFISCGTQFSLSSWALNYSLFPTDKLRLYSGVHPTTGNMEKK